MILMNINGNTAGSVRPEGVARRAERLEGLNGNTVGIHGSRRPDGLLTTNGHVKSSS